MNGKWRDFKFWVLGLFINLMLWLSTALPPTKFSVLLQLWASYALRKQSKLVTELLTNAQRNANQLMSTISGTKFPPVETQRDE